MQESASFHRAFSSELIQGEEKRSRRGRQEKEGLKEGGERDNEGEEVREGRAMNGGSTTAVSLLNVMLSPYGFYVQARSY